MLDPDEVKTAGKLARTAIVEAGFTLAYLVAQIAILGFLFGSAWQLVRTAFQ